MDAGRDGICVDARALETCRGEQMISGRSSQHARRVTLVALALAAMLAVGVLAGCGSDNSKIESAAKEQVEAGTKEVREGTQAAKEALKEAKSELNGEGAKQIKEGLKKAEEGIEQGKSQSEAEMKEVQKQIEEQTE
jgi:hypothetical protein